MIAKRGLRKKSLTISGAAAGILLAFFSILCHYSYLAALMAFFLSSSMATRYKAEDKRKIEGEAFKEGGQRNWVTTKKCNCHNFSLKKVFLGSSAVQWRSGLSDLSYASVISGHCSRHPH